MQPTLKVEISVCHPLRDNVLGTNITCPFFMGHPVSHQCQNWILCRNPKHIHNTRAERRKLALAVLAFQYNSFARGLFQSLLWPPNLITAPQMTILQRMSFQKSTQVTPCQLCNHIQLHCQVFMDIVCHVTSKLLKECWYQANSREFVF